MFLKNVTVQKKMKNGKMSSNGVMVLLKKSEILKNLLKMHYGLSKQDKKLKSVPEKEPSKKKWKTGKSLLKAYSPSKKK